MVDNLMPEHREDAAGTLDDFADETVASHASLSDDIVALIDDGKTYIEAELAFQKTRLAFAADRGKSGIMYGICAFAVVHLALIALVVGLIFALSPLLTAWGATAVVAGVLLVAGAILGIKAKNRFARLAEAYKEASE
ncbi:phage holin family protein [Allopontixanthobacter sediminis]|nr:phage holin family protein [Allopontixanthobacter sediminis]